MTTNFDAFKEKNKMMNEEKLKDFISLYQKNHNLTFLNLKKSLLLMDLPLIKFLKSVTEE